MLISTIDSFVNPRSTEDTHVSSLNEILISVKRGEADFQNLIITMGDYLTNSDDKIRSRSCLLLGEILTRLPMLHLTAGCLEHVCTFFMERLADHPSVAPCMQALLALFRNHAESIPGMFKVKC